MRGGLLQGEKGIGEKNLVDEHRKRRCERGGRARKEKHKDTCY